MSKEQELYDQVNRLKWHTHSQDEISNQTGWIPSSLTWTYASASTYTIPGDVTATYQKGTYLKWLQTTQKYAVIASSSYSAPKTTVTIIVNTDYTIANAEITSPYYSYAANPQGWPGWFAWSPTLTGYSANPTNAVYRFTVNGTLLNFIIREAGNGTSNAATLTISTPVTAKVYSGALWGGAAAYVDNGSASTVYGRWVIGSGESALTFGVNPTASGGFTSSGSKRISFCQGFYEI